MIEDKIRGLAQGPNFATISSILPSGRIQTHVIWVDADDEHILLNTEVHRQKYKNLEREPRATVVIWDKDNAYRFAEVRGTVVERVTGPEARAHIDKLSRKYTGRDYNESTIQTERVILKIAPERQIARG
jgi:PPOX class probable F420-dependent enzyme